ncbi:hypothetical protein P389DRAFT_191809 [Cystobasidium minutum MCA 4210]|uniref:uncharacterized protein n=1 Tax=Cystobasidium minutum MCA 4210 TaxID=1397322 RepID=UPI0034CF73CB|eukprot:jgi/Rhomi1/191809/gm1.23_g
MSSLSPAGSFLSTSSSDSSSSGFESSSDNDSGISITSTNAQAKSGTISPCFDKFWSSSDLVIRTSDGVDFKTHKARLAGSSVFEDMFDIGSDGVNSHHGESEVPIISLTEDARTLELVLPFFYDEYPDVDAMPFEDVLKALEASLKYGMPLVEHIYSARLKRMLPTLPVDQVFQLWARCSTLDKADIANEALRLTLKGDILQFATSEIDLLDPRAVDRLWRLHMQKQQKQNDLVFTYAWRMARGSCYYFEEKAHKSYMRDLLQAKSTGLHCESEEPLGFRTCEKCSKMAEELGLLQL